MECHSRLFKLGMNSGLGSLEDGGKRISKTLVSKLPTAMPSCTVDFFFFNRCNCIIWYESHAAMCNAKAFLEGL